MKIIRWLSNWGLLYLLAMVLIGGLVWVQSLNLKTSADDILSIALLVVFGFIVNSWIEHHQCNFMESDIEKHKVDQEEPECGQISFNNSERMN